MDGGGNPFGADCADEKGRFFQLYIVYPGAGACSQYFTEFQKYLEKRGIYLSFWQTFRIIQEIPERRSLRIF